jgi:peptidoglycan/xylan/chitin deacetylase (PgdA/CDA1 family)
MASRGIVFLMYHELELPGRPLCQSEPGYVRYILSETSFRSQMDWLRQNNWQALSVSEALTFPPGKSVAITFDDGSETDLTVAAPILKENGYDATFYVTAGFLDKPGYMSAEQLRQLSHLGFEIGCHSMTHAYLSDLGPAELEHELLHARSKLEDIIGKKVEHFSCPGGRYNERTLDLAKQAGYRSLATSRARPNFPSTNPFSLGRVAIMRDTGETAFSNVCAGSGLWKTQLSESTRVATRKLMGNRLYDRFRTMLLRT